MDNLKNFRKVISYLPGELFPVFKKIPYHTAIEINEVRLRTNRPVCVTVKGKSMFVTSGGGLSEHSSLGIMCTREHITESFRAVCDYSIHSYEKEISRGYITIEGGNRVGICGTAVGSGEKIETIKYISGLNFRIAGQVYGCADEICRRLFSSGNVGVLVAGVPLSGKTTVLRDMCRILGNRYRVSIVDERSEIAAVYHGEPQNDIGVFTDVLDGYDKKNGIETAIRVMSPDIVVCDEIGGLTDCRAIIEGLNSGVKFLASVHGSTFDEILSREHIKKLVDLSVFDYGVLLTSGSQPGIVSGIKKLRRNGTC